MSTSLAGWACQLAARAPARVFAITGVGAPGSPQDLRLRDELMLVDSPRSATILLVAGTLPEVLHAPAQRVHDQMSHPRRVVIWTANDAALASRPFPQAVQAGANDEVVDVLVRTQRDIFLGPRAGSGLLISDAPVLPDADPAHWRGVGPYGQGGTGMTGGVPYGRPLAGRAPDRDGLELDQLLVHVGPFFAPFPSGLVLEVKLQGDVIQDVTVKSNALAQTSGADGDARSCLFREALSQPVAIAALERARAVHHLRWLARALHLNGLDALGRRTLRLAVMLQRNPAASDSIAVQLRELAQLLHRARSIEWSFAGVGTLAAEQAAGCGLGPVARAAGVAEDVRGEDPAYRALGFEPVVQRGKHVGDALARCRQRLAEAEQSLTLAARAGAARTGGTGRVEGPRGVLGADIAPDSKLYSLLPGLLIGAEWGDAVTSVVSLDLAPYAAERGDVVANGSAPTSQPSTM